MSARACNHWFVQGLIFVLIGCNQTSPESQDTPATAAAATKNPAPAASISFRDVTLADVPDQILPDKTITGKSVGKLYTEVEKLWGEVALPTKDQKQVLRAEIRTEAGNIELELFPQLAPNHVRNFIALARAGYYDGLLFERAIVQRTDAASLELIEGGCPMGIGTAGYGSIGYWLAPEISDQLKHEAGTVGACRGENPDSAACRFYITLSPAPVLDGERTIFGRVVRGLDVARRIATQPVLNSPEFPDGTRPEKPIAIRKVTIQVQAVENPFGNSNNK